MQEVRRGKRTTRLATRFPARHVRAARSCFLSDILAAALRQSHCNFVRAAGDIATGDELHELTDPKFVGQHGTLQRQAKLNIPWKNADSVRICKMARGEEARAPDRKIRGSAGRACLDWFQAVLLVDWFQPVVVRGGVVKAPLMHRSDGYKKCCAAPRIERRIGWC